MADDDRDQVFEQPNPDVAKMSCDGCPIGTTCHDHIDGSHNESEDLQNFIASASPIRFWIFEMAAMAAAILVLIATILVLVRYNGKEQPQWPFKINLSTLLSISSTVSRTLSVYVLASSK